MGEPSLTGDLSASAGAGLIKQELDGQFGRKVRSR